MATEFYYAKPGYSSESLAAPLVAAAGSCTEFFRRVIRGREHAPQKLLFKDDEAEIEFYARTAFTAWEHALFRKRHHPKLWKAVQGSPYEGLYRARFQPEKEG